MEVELQSEPLPLRYYRLLANFVTSNFTHTKQYLIDLLRNNTDCLFLQIVKNILSNLDLELYEPRKQKVRTKIEIQASLYRDWEAQRQTSEKGKHHAKLCSPLRDTPIHWKIPELTRKTQIAITRLRLGHAFTNQHKNKLFGGDASPTCRLCSQNLESIEHLLTQCPQLHHYHTKFKTTFSKFLPELSPDDIDFTLILGREHPHIEIPKKVRKFILKILIDIIHHLYIKNIHL